MGVSKNNGTPKSSVLIGFSIINHPFWGTPIFGNIHIWYTPLYMSHLDGAAAEQLAQPCPGGETLPLAAERPLTFIKDSLSYGGWHQKLPNWGKKYISELGKSNFFGLASIISKGQDILFALRHRWSCETRSTVALVASRHHVQSSRINFLQDFESSKEVRKNHFETCYKVGPYQL